MVETSSSTSRMACMRLPRSTSILCKRSGKPMSEGYIISAHRPESGLLFEAFANPSTQYRRKCTCCCPGKTYDNIFLPTISKPAALPQYKVEQIAHKSNECPNKEKCQQERNVLFHNTCFEVIFPSPKLQNFHRMPLIESEKESLNGDNNT